jgi:hypothetical protein
MHYYVVSLNEVTGEHDDTTEIQAVCRLSALNTLLTLPVAPFLRSSFPHIKICATKEIFLPSLNY